MLSAKEPTKQAPTGAQTQQKSATYKALAEGHTSDTAIRRADDVLQRRTSEARPVELPASIQRAEQAVTECYA